MPPSSRASDQTGDGPAHAVWINALIGALALLFAALACAVDIWNPTSAARIACAAALLPLALVVGWCLGVHHRVALRREIWRRQSDLRRALTELEIAQAETVRRLSMAVEFRDEDTGAHIERIGRFSTLLAEKVGMDPDFCKRISHAAPLHDVGKVAIPDSILLKPGPLTAEERAIVETHAEEGYRLLRGSSSTILDLAATIALSHHERWDGTGYPRGVAGEQIPIEGRIVAIADVFDALTSDRVYREAFTVEEAIEMMQAERGRHFDPVLLDVFLDVLASSGPDGRRDPEEDPRKLSEQTLETYATAIERGDAEMAEGAIADAIERGVAPARLHGEVLLPALARTRAAVETGELEPDAEQLAIGITRRVLATVYRYMLGGTEPHRERLLLAGVEGDDHGLMLQMIHDQLAAAGFRTSLYGDLSVERLETIIDGQPPDMVLIGATLPETVQPMERMVAQLGEQHPEIAVIAAGDAASRLQRRWTGVEILRRIEDAVPVVEQLLAARSQSERPTRAAASA